MTKKSACSSNASFDTCEDWPTDNADDNTKYGEARQYASAGATGTLFSSALNSATLTAITLFALFLTHAFIKFGIISKHLNNTVVVVLTKVAFVFGFVNLLSTCSIVSWNGTYTDELGDEAMETGAIANAFFAFNILNFVFIVAVDVLNMLGKTEAKGKNSVSP